MITLESFIADLKAEFSTWDSAGLIDETSIHKWINKALLKFGSNIMNLQDTVIEVNNSTGTIPSNFFSLYSAYLCDRKGHSPISKKERKVLQDSYGWIERVERSNKWVSCDACCVEEEEKTIIERKFFKDIEVDFYYENPTLLRLGKTFDRNTCHRECRNKIVRDCPNEIIIIGNTLQTNFREGNVYMQFYGLPQDESGNTIIPHSPKGELETYLEYHVKRKILENIIVNQDDSAASNMFGFYNQKEVEQLGLALTDTKLSRLTPNSFRRLKKINRAEMHRYELMYPKY